MKTNLYCPHCLRELTKNGGPSGGYWCPDHYYCEYESWWEGAKAPLSELDMLERLLVRYTAERDRYAALVKGYEEKIAKAQERVRQNLGFSTFIN